MPPCIAALEAGPSSISFTLYDAGVAERVRYRGQIESIGAAPRLRVWNGEGRQVAELSWRPDALDHRGASREVLRTAADLIHGAPVIAVGHRTAHGGGRSGAARVDRDLLIELAALSQLAPSRQPYNLAAMEALAEAAPHIPQVACFDTAFAPTSPVAISDVHLAIARQTRDLLGLDGRHGGAPSQDSA